MLQGINGEPGQRGLPGPVGAKGVRGDQGLKGDIGHAGLQGRPGDLGPPVSSINTYMKLSILYKKYFLFFEFMYLNTQFLFYRDLKVAQV